MRFLPLLWAVGLALAAVAAVVLLAHAADEHTLSTPDDCVPWEPLGKYVKAHGHTIVELDADQRGAVVRFYNAKPPESDLHPARVFTSRIDGNTLVVFVDAAGCMADYGLIPNDEFGDWLSEGGI